MNVMVGVPTITNRMTIQVQRFMDLLRVASQATDVDFKVRFSVQNGKSPVEYARNTIVGDFLRSDCEHLLFLDDDMLPQDSVARLFHSKADITAAQIYTFDHSNPEASVTVGLKLCALKANGNGFYSPLIPAPGSSAVQDVDVVGTGCTLVARRVLEDRRMWLDGAYLNVDGTAADANVDEGGPEFAPAVFQWRRAPNGASIMGEDFDFCERAKALGYSIQVDLNARCGHYKSINIDEAGDLAGHVLARAFRGMKGQDGKIYRYVAEEATA